jgi:beta-glucanase (GH16 family)
MHNAQTCYGVMNLMERPFKMDAPDRRRLRVRACLGQYLCGWGNAELQWYRPENTVASDRTLKIIAKKEAFNNKGFTSSRIRTRNKVDIDLTQDNVRIEARLKVPDDGNGFCPAFWMLPSERDATAWPTGGEIDIMEFIGQEPWHAHGYLHYGNAFNDRVVKGGHLYTPDFVYEDFHEYAIEKKPGEISSFFRWLQVPNFRRRCLTILYLRQ